MIESAKFYLSLVSRDVAHGYLAVPRRTPVDRAEALGAAIDWICKAQDASGDGGVARSYSLAYHRFFKKRGWTASYPETTGYIIPTMFDYARKTQRVLSKCSMRFYRRWLSSKRPWRRMLLLSSRTETHARARRRKTATSMPVSNSPRTLSSKRIRPM